MRGAEIPQREPIVEPHSAARCRRRDWSRSGASATPGASECNETTHAHRIARWRGAVVARGASATDPMRRIRPLVYIRYEVINSHKKYLTFGTRITYTRPDPALRLPHWRDEAKDQTRARERTAERR